MSRCTRCGRELEDERYLECADEDTQFSEGASYTACLERQLSNQASLLRSVTGKLEEARELLDGTTEARTMFAAAALIDSVLEVLS